MWFLAALPEDNTYHGATHPEEESVDPVSWLLQEDNSGLRKRNSPVPLLLIQRLNSGCFLHHRSCSSALRISFVLPSSNIYSFAFKKKHCVNTWTNSPKTAERLRRFGSKEVRNWSKTIPFYSCWVWMPPYCNFRFYLFTTENVGSSFQTFFYNVTSKNFGTHFNKLSLIIT